MNIYAVAQSTAFGTVKTLCYEINDTDEEVYMFDYNANSGTSTKFSTFILLDFFKIYSGKLIPIENENKYTSKISYIIIFQTNDRAQYVQYINEYMLVEGV